MDPIIKKYKYVQSRDLNICEEKGVAYQINMDKSVKYDFNYFHKYSIYEKTELGKKLNKKRLDAVKKWAENLKIIDIGIGCGTFIKQALKHNLNITGYDINPHSIKWLNDNNIYEYIYKSKEKNACYTFWDSLEHIPEPQKILKKIRTGSYVFISMPIFDSLDDIFKSKHYRPNEHYYYFTSTGLIKWLREYGLQIKQITNFEEKLGRENIKTFFLEKEIKRSKNLRRKKLVNFFKKQERKTKTLIKKVKRRLGHGL